MKNLQKVDLQQIEQLQDVVKQKLRIIIYVPPTTLQTRSCYCEQHFLRTLPEFRLAEEFQQDLKNNNVLKSNQTKHWKYESNKAAVFLP